MAAIDEHIERVESNRSQIWAPGSWGSRLTRDAKWSATLDGEVIQISGAATALSAIKAVRIERGLLWARVFIERQDGRELRLGGLTNSRATEFLDLLISACIRHSHSRLTSLIKDVMHQHDLWSRLMEAPRWVTQSQVERFVAGLPGNSSGSDLASLIERQFTKVAKTYLNEHERSLLAYVHGSELPKIASARNRRFLTEELQRYKDFFDQVEKHPLTDEQREASVVMDDRVMTVASAGSGKTALMVAKAGYAIVSGLFEPREILLLAFNRKAAEELATRVDNQLAPMIKNADQIKVATFHSLGLEILSQSTGRRPVLAPCIEKGTELSELQDIIRALREESDFAEQWHLYQTVLARSLPPFGAPEEPEWWDRDTGRQGFLTLRGETVKSQEERMICDWLADHGIQYEYERPYEVDTATSDRRQYLPDFYYPSASVYHEHFALDEHNNPPPHFTGYADGVRWKRALHEERGTYLVETTSHGIRSRGGFSKLKADLQAHDVKFGEVTLTDEQMQRMSDEASLLKVFRTFLSHVKSNRLIMNELRQRAVSRDSEHPYRDQLFLDIFESIWKEWDRRLKAAGAVDFDDMLACAADDLAQGRAEMPYKLIMADEFQDTSRARAALLRELAKAADARLFVVGDDWQAVNRFAGADISLMRNFEKYFGNSAVLKLTKTFRCPSDLCDLAGAFVMANPYQLKKAVISTNQRESPSVICFQLDDIDSQEAVLSKHLHLLADRIRLRGEASPVSAYVLGRNRFNEPGNLSEIRGAVADVIDLHYSTVHSAKGLEADYVFLMNVIEDTYGFPSKIDDDSTLWIAMPEGEDFHYAEERRLFYVALTRAKRLVTIYTDSHRRSEFIAELERQGGRIEFRAESGPAANRRSCPECLTGVLVKKKGAYGWFLSCSRFPRCDYTEKISKAGQGVN